MKVQNEKDFLELRNYINKWKKKFPMFLHDVQQIENIVEHHIQEHSKILVKYRQTKNKSHLEKAQQELDSINRVLELVSKLELMAMLSRG